MSQKVIRNISNKVGTVTDGKGSQAKIRFSLTERLELIDGHIPSTTSATGTIEFESPSKAFYFFSSGGAAVLRGGGIEASIIINSPTSFKTTGPITDLPKK